MRTSDIKRLGEAYALLWNPVKSKKTKSNLSTPQKWQKKKEKKHSPLQVRNTMWKTQ